MRLIISSNSLSFYDEINMFKDRSQNSFRCFDE